MKFFRMASCTALVLLVSGCAQPLGPDNSVTSKIASTHTSEQAFRNLLRVMKECYPDSVTIRPNFFPEAKEGEIDLFSGNEFGNIPIGTWSIKPTPSGSLITQVRSWRNSRLDAVTAAWVDGDSRNCPYGTRSEPRPPGSELNQNNMPVR